jgi:membrane carboxypeptidase/penicillin-binding protein PbpC
MWRKVKEAFLALALEHQLSKKEILEAYVNNIEYGNGSRGIAEASRHFFGKTPDKLTLGESAVLVGAVPYVRNGNVQVTKIDVGRQTSLSRLRFFFPGKYAESDIEKAGSIPMGELLRNAPATLNR